MTIATRMLYMLAWLCVSDSAGADEVSCPCEFGTIANDAWLVPNSVRGTFDKVANDSGLLCTHRVYSSGAEHFSVFARFVGLSGDKKSESLTEIRAIKVAAGMRCLMVTERTGEFSGDDNARISNGPLSANEFDSCLADAQSYAAQLGVTCEGSKASK